MIITTDLLSICVFQPIHVDFVVIILVRNIIITIAISYQRLMILIPTYPALQEQDWKSGESDQWTSFQCRQGQKHHPGNTFEDDEEVYYQENMKYHTVLPPQV